MILGFEDSRQLAKRIAQYSRLPYNEIKINRFPDGESLITIPEEVKGRNVWIVRTLFDPNQKLVELLFAAHTCKEFKAKKVNLIAPYLCYMRQDKRFNKGEVVSSKIIARLFDEYFDGMITIDPHFHRIKKMSDLFKLRGKTLTANALVADYIKKNIKNPVIIGPDSESFQWVNSIAKKVGCRSTVMKKVRYSSRRIENKFVENIDINGKSIVIVDDIISTGKTMLGAIKCVKKIGVKVRGFYCIGVHGVLIENAYKKLRLAHAEVITTNTISNQTSKIDVSKLISNSLW